MCRVVLIAVALTFAIASSISIAEDSVPAERVAAQIDGFLESHWSANGIQPAGPVDDATFLRRASLDLIGRIPTPVELDQFLNDKSDAKRRQLIERLIKGPEFPLHLGNVLDQIIQGRYAGNQDFIDYLRRSVRDSKSWDQVFREIMLGPWENEQSKPANRFLDKRAKTSDVLAVDAARVFFGVDISCAKCHDHPLVDDWKQEHFYGMVAFFNRTTGGKGKIGEKKDGEVKFLGGDGEEKVAKMMFLSGQVIEEPPTSGDKKAASISRRKQLVDIALDQRDFFSRAMVNRTWEYFFGRGLVDPVDQMHSANTSAVPGLLSWLADDFAESGYDLRRLITAIVNSRVYQLSSRWEQDGRAPEASLFAASRLRPLTGRQLAFSMVVATGNGELNEPSELQSRVARYSGVTGLSRIEQYLAIEQRAAELVNSFDQRRADFQSSAREALFMSNNPAAQELIAARENNLAMRLSRIADTKKLVSTAVRALLCRQPTEKESTRLEEWINDQSDRRKASEQLVWALVTSAEFRFIH